LSRTGQGPYYGTISKALEEIKEASTPDRFTQDFLATKLGLKGGSPKPVIPFLKRTGFLGSDGSPTSLYKRFRNPAETGSAAAEALRKGHKALYQVNEYAHELNDGDLKGLVVQVSGLQGDSSTTKAIIESFRALKKFADFDATPIVTEEEIGGDEGLPLPLSGEQVGTLRFAYSINLHLPATSDVAVFNAIFRSLREHLLR
jgi:Family of unknown function (DUF5343)